MAGIFQNFQRVFFQMVRIPLSDGTVQLPCLTEAAAPDTAALDFQYASVLCDFDKGNHRLYGITDTGHVHDDFLLNDGRYTLFQRKEPFNGTVFLIFHIVETRHIQSRQLCSTAQERHASQIPLTAFLIEVKEFTISRLSFADIKNIKKICQRFRIVGTRAAADNGAILPTLCCQNRNLCQIQYLEYIRITHFILYGNSQKVKFPHRILRFQRKQRYVFFSHDGIQIYPG